jgi:uncharacterized membrane protein
MADFSILSLGGRQRMGLPLNSCYLLPSFDYDICSPAVHTERVRQLNKTKTNMTILLSGLILFFGIHAIPMFPSFKASLQSHFGEMRFKGIYSLVAVSGFLLILLGMSRAEYHPVFTPPAWAPLIAYLAMPISFCLLVAAFVPNNFRRVIRHPMLSGVIVWAVVHLLANGDLASILLFGLFGLYAVIDIVAVNLRSPATVPARQPLLKDVLVLAIGFAAFWIVRYYHVALFGVPVVPGQ